ncbi:MAG: IPT/TIG domain-containing protein, partial [Mycobacterium sp.]|nr:IPT/TIG domain-containing protein [Mycobacterium sp.]
ITHNQLDDLPYSGISFGWGGWHTNSQTPNANANINSDNLVADNLIFNHMQYLRDGGAIYTNGSQGQSFTHGLTISGNVAYDDNTDNEYYTDEGSQYVTISGNTAYANGGNFNGGCSTTGHIRVVGNYNATSLNGFGCSPPAVDIQSSGNTPIPWKPRPGDVPDQVLAQAGLEPAYQYLVTGAPPVVAAIGPDSGDTAGGTRVLISGSGFTPGTRVSFGNQPAAATSVLSPNYLTATSPAGSGVVDVTVTTAAGESPATSADRFTYQAPYPSLAAAYDNVGITDDTDTNTGNIDGWGSSFSASALAALGVTPGAQIHYAGLTFTWPAAQPGTADNVLADGQIIDLAGSGSTLGLLLTSCYPTTSSGTVVYSDGTAQTFTIDLPNWDAPRTGDNVVFTTAYRNRPGNTQDTDKVSVFYTGVPLAAGKTVKQLILPAVGNTVGIGVPSLHVWSVAIG